MSKNKLKSPQTLDFFHDGQEYSIPRAQSFTELQFLVRGRVMDRLRQIKEEKPESENDLCLTWFAREGERRSGDSPTMNKNIKNFMKSIGEQLNMSIPDILPRPNPCYPSRDEFLERMKGNPQGSVSGSRTYILSPASAPYVENYNSPIPPAPGKNMVEIAWDGAIALQFNELLKSRPLENISFVSVSRVLDKLKG